MDPIREISAPKSNIFSDVQLPTKKVKALHIGKKTLHDWRPARAVHRAGAELTSGVYLGGAGGTWGPNRRWL